MRGCRCSVEGLGSGRISQAVEIEAPSVQNLPILASLLTELQIDQIQRFNMPRREPRDTGRHKLTEYPKLARPVLPTPFADPREPQRDDRSQDDREQREPTLEPDSQEPGLLRDLLCDLLCAAGCIIPPLCLQCACLQQNGPIQETQNRPVNIGRDDWIRTSDPLTPSQVRYQAALHPVFERL